MVPTSRPSPKTSIFAPTRCGVDPVVETMVTSAAGSPRSSASATAANTSRFISGDYTGRTTPAAQDWRGPSRSAVQIADFVRFGALEERLADHFRTLWAGELAGLGIDVHEGDAGRRLERNAGMPGERRAHELGPDWQRGARAAQADGLVVVEPDPHHREQLRREADEPGVAKVVGRAGLAGRIEGEPHAARARRRALVQHTAHHVGDEERRVGPGNLARRRRLLLRHVLAAAFDAQNLVERPHDAAVRKQRVGGRNLVRRGFEDAERDRWVGLRRVSKLEISPE